jgi:hypothetical protein
MTPFREVLEDALRNESRSDAPLPHPSVLPRFPHTLFNDAPSAVVQQRAPWAIELDVDLPCDPQTVRRAFRRLALKTHPDRPGGSHQAFLRAKATLEEALAALRESETASIRARVRPGSEWSVYA